MKRMYGCVIPYLVRWQMYILGKGVREKKWAFLSYGRNGIEGGIFKKIMCEQCEFRKGRWFWKEEPSLCKDRATERVNRFDSSRTRAKQDIQTTGVGSTLVRGWVGGEPVWLLQIQWKAEEASWELTREDAGWEAVWKRHRLRWRWNVGKCVSHSARGKKSSLYLCHFLAFLNELHGAWKL